MANSTDKYGTAAVICKMQALELHVMSRSDSLYDCMWIDGPPTDRYQQTYDIV